MSDETTCPSGNTSCGLCGYGVAPWRTGEYVGTLVFIGAENYGMERCYGFSDGRLIRVPELDASCAADARCTQMDTPQVGDEVRLVYAATALGARGHIVRIEVLRRANAAA